MSCLINVTKNIISTLRKARVGSKEVNLLKQKLIRLEGLSKQKTVSGSYTRPSNTGIDYTNAKTITAQKQRKADAPWLLHKDAVWVQRVTPSQANILNRQMKGHGATDKQLFSLIENFGNPFVVKGKTGNTSMEVPLGTAKEVSDMYYNWLKDGTIPEGYPKQELDNLAKRRAYILSNLDMIRNAKELWYWREPDNNVTHVDALVKIATEEQVLSDISKDISQQLLPVKKRKNIVNIDSSQKGLEAALTNPTELARSKGNLQESYGIMFNGKYYKDVEEAYQKLKDTSEARTKPKKEVSKNYALMVSLIETKLKTFPRLVKAIDDRGGLEYLGQIVHQPTNKNTVWETGGQDWFKSALIDAYNSIKIVKSSGFQGYVGGFDDKGKGTAEGDGKDKAMRKVADGFIGEIATRMFVQTPLTSTRTSADTIASKNDNVYKNNGTGIYYIPTTGVSSINGFKYQDGRYVYHKALNTHKISGIDPKNTANKILLSSLIKATDFVLLDTELEDILKELTGKNSKGVSASDHYLYQEVKSIIPKLVTAIRKGSSPASMYSAETMLADVENLFDLQNKAEKLMRQLVEGTKYKLDINPNDSLYDVSERFVEGANQKVEHKANIVMLAKNGFKRYAEMFGKEKAKELANSLTNDTKNRILEAHNNGATFIVGDMPGVDTQFIEYLDKIGASYKIYHTGSTPRIKIETKGSTELKSEVVGTSRTAPREYYNTLNKLVRGLLGPKVKTSEYLALTKATLENLALVGGTYAKEQNKITLSKKPRQEALDAQSRGIIQEWWENNSPYASEYLQMNEEELAKVLKEDKSFQRMIKEHVSGVNEEVLVEFAKMNGMHTLAHEMVHVGAKEYMEANPNSIATKRVQKLYELALENKPKILELMGEGRSEYWATSIDEFIAEGLSNPDLIYALNNIKVDLGGKLVTIFREVLKTLARMIGVMEKDTAYAYLLDGYLRMLESRPMNTKVSNMLDKVRKEYQDDKLTAELERAKERLSTLDNGIELLARLEKEIENRKGIC